MGGDVRVQAKSAEGKAELQRQPSYMTSTEATEVEGAKRFLPFSTGPRGCLGQSLGRMMHDAAIAHLFAHFHMVLAERVRYCFLRLRPSCLALFLGLCYCIPGALYSCICLCLRSHVPSSFQKEGVNLTFFWPFGSFVVTCRVGRCSLQRRAYRHTQVLKMRLEAVILPCMNLHKHY